MLNDIHADLLAKALDKILGKAQEGSIAFVRCLDPSVVRGLEPIPCGSLQWREDDSSAIIEIARRQGESLETV